MEVDKMLSDTFDRAGGPHPRDYSDFGQWAKERSFWFAQQVKREEERKKKEGQAAYAAAVAALHELAGF